MPEINDDATLVPVSWIGPERAAGRSAHCGATLHSGASPARIFFTLSTSAVPPLATKPVVYLHFLASFRCRRRWRSSFSKSWH